MRSGSDDYDFGMIQHRLIDNCSRLSVLSKPIRNQFLRANYHVQRNDQNDHDGGHLYAFH
jgi:hypothetical protein